MATSPAGSKSVRGPAFSAAEDLALARAWVATSEFVLDMNAEVFWDRTAALYIAQPGVVFPRTSHSLRSRWSGLQRMVQKYLAADKLYRSSIPSGEVEDDTKRHVMELYQKNNQVSTKPRTVPAKPLSSRACRQLSS